MSIAIAVSSPPRADSNILVARVRSRSAAIARRDAAFRCRRRQVEHRAGGRPFGLTSSAVEQSRHAAVLGVSVNAGLLAEMSCRWSVIGPVVVGLGAVVRLALVGSQRVVLSVGVETI